MLVHSNDYHFFDKLDAQFQRRCNFSLAVGLQPGQRGKLMDLWSRRKSGCNSGEANNNRRVRREEKCEGNRRVVPSNSCAIDAPMSTANRTNGV